MFRSRQPRARGGVLLTVSTEDGHWARLLRLPDVLSWHIVAPSFARSFSDLCSGWVTVSFGSRKQRSELHPSQSGPYTSPFLASAPCVDEFCAVTCDLIMRPSPRLKCFVKQSCACHGSGAPLSDATSGFFWLKCVWSQFFLRLSCGMFQCATRRWWSWNPSLARSGCVLRRVPLERRGVAQGVPARELRMQHARACGSTMRTHPGEGEASSCARDSASTPVEFPAATLLAYREQLRAKVKWVRHVLSEHVLHLPEKVFPSAPCFYRTRCEFCVKPRSGGGIRLLMRASRTGVPPLLSVPGVPADYETDEGEDFEVRFFPVACRMINAAIEGLREYVRFMPRSTPLIDSLFLVHFQATSTEQCVISLLYRTEPRDGWLPLATDLQERLRSHIQEAGFAGPIFVAA